MSDENLYSMQNLGFQGALDKFLSGDSASKLGTVSKKDLTTDFRAMGP